MSNLKSVRIAWVVPTNCFYWQVILNEFVDSFPNTKIFTSRWLKTTLINNNLDVELVGNQKVFRFKPQYNSYGSKFAYMSPRIISRLLRYKPELIFVDTFCIWTLLVLLAKPLGRWKVILAYEGSSPGVDYSSSLLRIWIRRLMVKIADTLITNSQAGKAYLEKVLDAREDKVFVHPYFVPDAKLLKTPQGKDLTTSLATYQKPIFLFIGRLIPRKNIQSLLAACVKLKNWGDNDYSLLVIGEGQQEAELRTFCQDNGIEKQIKWIGQVEYSAIANYLHQSDILILPSREDTWGMVVLEAILSGKAVFCSTGAGASEIIAQVKNGDIFEPEDTEKLAQLMKNAIKRPESIIQMGRKSQEIRDRYTPAVAIKFLAEIAKLTLEDKRCF